MALSMLAGGAECGPSNPLQGLTKRFDQDRGIQQDHFGASRAGSSRETFRTASNPATHDQDAARFFSAHHAPALSTPDAAYDVSALRAALPPQLPMPAHASQLQHPGPLVDWAADFTLQQPLHTPQLNASKGKEVVAPRNAAMSNIHMPQNIHAGVPQGNMQWNANPRGIGLGAMKFSSPPLMQMPKIVTHNSQISWDKEFSTQEMALVLDSATSQQPLAKEESARQIPHDTDELARTAGLLLDNVKHEQNPKFQNSQFMNLMRKLRDRDIIVEGNQMVENQGQQTSVDVKGKGRASESIPWHASQKNTSRPQVGRPTGAADTNFADNARQELSQSNSTVEEDANDAYFRQENVEYQQYWNDARNANRSQAGTTNAEVSSWEHLQKDWDHFEATTTGIRHVDYYQFQDNNPYMLGDSSTTRQHLVHTGYQSLSESVLQLEAAVQRDMNNAAAWFELGVKQQENERENKALQALRRAAELDPGHLHTWLALAVSNTNEGNRVATYDAITEWVDRNVRYQGAVQQFRAHRPLHPDATLSERYQHLIDILIVMARSDTSGVVDAEIQIALAVLLNTNEEYGKAQDCFLAALAVRPEDWLLYNRVGATMANSGHAEDALHYYYKALELNPGYIRARFNLGISCINLRRYEEAAQHILDALVLQDNDGIRDPGGLNEKRGVTSMALWDSLKTTCLHMQRIDLATLCDRRDLEAFRINFQM
ncbi:putative tetratricopeptide repeat [Lyophyllum shimeji]|uniref:Tetratricopeptide repeat n=1 Tax=Lyophyllum shimeji TaxID=47721 RepID=A0A9P3PJY2_LYOSH|nr:putative tetratricopeptide repeat [Lyophyllum shimeji]